MPTALPPTEAKSSKGPPTIITPGKNVNSKYASAVFTLLVMITVLGVGAVVAGFVTKISSKLSQIEDLSKTNENLQLKVRNLETMMDSSGLFITLQKELILASNNKLGVWLPDVTKKLLELQERYKDDKLTVSFILALVEVESNFDPKATSTAIIDGKQVNVAYGLTQVVRSTAISYLNELNYPWSQEVLYDPVLSLEVGIRYIIDLHRQNVAEGIEKPGDYNWTVLMYYFGERAVKNSMKLPLNSNSGISLQYWDKFNKSRRKWEEKGF